MLDKLAELVVRKGANVQPGQPVVIGAAVQNAASVASMLLTTECLITDIKEEKEAPMPNPGMGGMGGMM